LAYPKQVVIQVFQTGNAVRFKCFTTCIVLVI